MPDTSELELEESLDKSLRFISNELLNTPAGKEILERAKTGEISPEQASLELGRLLSPTSLEKLSAQAFEIFSKVGDRPITMTTSTGLTQLNPVYEAAILERVFLDGDVPELRTGPPPRDNFSPAAPVLTNSLDPIQVGWMLKSKSEEILAKFKEADKLLETKNFELARVEEERTRSVPGYEIGKLPGLAVVETPTLEELTALSPTQRRDLSYRVISTTQGRVSICRPLAKQIARNLREMGWNIQIGSPQGQPTLSHAWTMNLYGAEDLNDGVNYIHTAESALTRSIESKLTSSKDFSRAQNLLLEITPYNGISERRFGWILKIGVES